MFMHILEQSRIIFLFFIFYLTAIEAHFTGFFRTKGEISSFSFIANLTFGIFKGKVYDDLGSSRLGAIVSECRCHLPKTLDAIR